MSKTGNLGASICGTAVQIYRSRAYAGCRGTFQKPETPLEQRTPDGVLLCIDKASGTEDVHVHCYMRVPCPQSPGDLASRSVTGGLMWGIVGLEDTKRTS